MENPNRLEIPAIFHKHLSQFFNTQDISIISEMFTLQNHFELYLVFSLAPAFFLLPLGIRIFVANEACLLKPQVEMGISENYANILQFEYSFSKACFAYAKFFLFFFFLSKESLDFNRISLLQPQLDLNHETKLQGFVCCIKPQAHIQSKALSAVKTWNFVVGLGNGMTFFIHQPNLTIKL